MKNIKMLLSLLLVLVIISVSVTPIFAEDIEILENEIVENDTISTEDEYIVADEEEKGPYNNDQKIICTATIDEDFDESSVLVVLKNEASLDFDSFSCPDFSEVNPKNVREITEVRSDRIFNEFSSKKTEYATELRNIAVANNNNNLSRSSVSTSVNETLSAVDNKLIEENAEVIAKAELDEEYSSFHKILCIDLNTSDKQSVLDAIKELEKCEEVLSAEPNYCSIERSSTTNDTYHGSQWALDNASIRSAWDIETGDSSVKVGIIDDGIDANHPDLADNYDTQLSKSFTDAPASKSYEGHGTAVAGIIGAVGNNSVGISGVCWDVSLVSLRVDGSNGEWQLSNTIDAITYATVEEIPILNHSSSIKLIDNDSISSLNVAIYGYDGVFITSAGNGSANIDDTSPTTSYVYPSVLTLNNIISVASIDQNNVLASGEDGSNYGKTSVDLAAPGVNVYSTVKENLNYKQVNGTSFSAPYVAGVAALIKSKYPDITTLGIRRAILDNVDKVATLTNYVSTGGKLNAYKALASIPNRTFTVVYDGNGANGGIMSNSTFTYGFYKNLSNLGFGKTGYKFAGWDAHRASDDKRRYIKDGVQKWFVEGTEEDGYSKCLYPNQALIAHTSPTANDTVTMIAQWTPITYNVEFDLDGGSGTMSSLTCSYDTSYTLQQYTGTKSGYKFDGWRVYKYDDETQLWLYTNGNHNMWFTLGNNTSAYSIVEYGDGATFTNMSIFNDEDIYFMAQWLLLGDVDLDGEVSIIDVTILQSYLVGQTELTEEQLERCDFDGDGDISVLDATAIQIYLSTNS